MERNPYQVLGVSRAADQDQIKKQFRRLAKENHPDLHPDDPEAEARFQELQAAYALLSDPAKRRLYDSGSQPFLVEPIDPATFGFDRVFADLFAAPATKSRATPRVTRLFSTQSVPDPNFADLEADRERGPSEVTVRIPAKTARDGGLIAIPAPTGEQLRFRIPPGVRDGARMRLAGKGPGGGDLIARIVIS